MKIEIVIGLTLFFFTHFGIVYGQQAQGQDKPALVGQPSQEAPSYMGGKDHYLPDSPSYMSGKKHYLPKRSISKAEEPSQDNAQTSVSKEEQKSGKTQTFEIQEGIPIQIRIKQGSDNSDIND